MMVKEGLCLIVFILYANIDAAAHPDVSLKCKFLCTISKTARVKKLFNAITSQDSETFQYLIERDQNLVKAYDEDGNTPLLRLLELDKHKEEFWKRNIPFILGFHAELFINAPDRLDRWTPLLRAVNNNNVTLELVQLVVQRGANINESKGKEADTPLMLAARNGRRDIVEYLLQKGADPTSKDSQDRTAADWARIKKHKDLATYIENFKAGDCPRNS